MKTLLLKGSLLHRVKDQPRLRVRGNSYRKKANKNYQPKKIAKIFLNKFLNINYKKQKKVL